MQQIDVPIDTVKPFQSVADDQRKYYPKRTRVKTVIYTNKHDDDNDNIPKQVPKPKESCPSSTFNQENAETTACSG